MNIKTDKKMKTMNTLPVSKGLKGFKHFAILLLMLLFATSSNLFSQYLKVSCNKRYLVTNDEKPFFWMGDTAWELIHKLDSTEIKTYLRDRAAKGFNVIQIAIHGIGECDGLTTPTPEGFLPLENFDPEKPNADYFKKLDWVVETAAGCGLYVALVPTWGAYVGDKPHSIFGSYHIFTEKNAHIYGEFLGSRYKNNWNIIWMSGGDRPPTGYEDIWIQMIKGLRKGSNSKQLITYHVSGNSSVTSYPSIANELDFYMLQSGHGNLATPNYKMISNDYSVLPTKPVIDGEPVYEDIPIAFNTANGYSTDYESRRAQYWSVFAGGFGVTYGHNAIWQMNQKEYPEFLAPLTYWTEALNSKGSFQVAHLKNLMLSRPFLTRIPDSTLIKPYNYEADFKLATRDGNLGKNDATYIMSYHPVFESWTTLNTSVIASKNIRVWLYDPRNGLAYFLGEQANTGSYNIASHNPIKKHMGGPDWVFVIDGADSNYLAPGVVRD